MLNKFCRVWPRLQTSFSFSLISKSSFFFPEVIDLTNRCFLQPRESLPCWILPIDTQQSRQEDVSLEIEQTLFCIVCSRIMFFWPRLNNGSCQCQKATKRQSFTESVLTFDDWIYCLQTIIRTWAWWRIGLKPPITWGNPLGLEVVKKLSYSTSFLTFPYLLKQFDSFPEDIFARQNLKMINVFLNFSFRLQI